MSLGAVVDNLGAFLMDNATPRPALSGGTAPSGPSQLPAVTLSLSDASRIIEGVGRIPRPPRKGALRVDTSVDLASPVLRFPGEPDVPLLGAGRLTFQLPHAPIVTADGSAVAPLGGSDLIVRVGATTYTVVAGAPTGNQVRPDRESGVLTFGSALPATGTLQLGYFIGQWDVRSARYRGLLGVEITAANAGGVETLSRSVDRVLLREPIGSVPGLRTIAPEGWGVVGASAVSASARARTVRYRIDYELEEPVVPTGGGVIAVVRVVNNVDSRPGMSPLPEPFDVTR